jgi:hypothetical protein
LSDLDVLSQRFGAIIEFMIAERHSVGPNDVHQLNLRSPECEGRDRASLKIIAGVEHEYTRQRSSKGINVSCHGCASTDEVAGIPPGNGVANGDRVGRVVCVEVVPVKNGERELLTLLPCCNSAGAGSKEENDEAQQSVHDPPFECVWTKGMENFKVSQRNFDTTV